MILHKPLPFVATIALVSSVLAAPAADNSDSAPTVTLGSLQIVGAADVHGTQDFFGGIPYAEPPIGDLRLRPPQPKVNWTDTTTFDASNWGPMCLQDISWLGGLPVPFAEDCLSINIARPAGTTNTSELPVMAWIHGGSFTGGGSILYNGSTIVTQSIARDTPIIYVNFNYRLGSLGFPVGTEAEQEGILNLGLKDQRLALEWLQENIAAFGGDPAKVTVFGESAGAISINAFLLNPSFDQLARGAILQSGSIASAPLFNASTEEKNLIWENYVAAAVPECAQAEAENTTSSLDCLRGVENTTVLVEAWLLADQASVVSAWRPSLDAGAEDAVLPAFPSEVYASGNFSRIPFITGANLDEATSFVPRDMNYTTNEIREMLLTGLSPSHLSSEELGQVIDQVLDLYPDDPSLGSPYGTGSETFGLSTGYKRWSSIFGDKDAQAGRRGLNRVASQTTDVQSWGYLFTDPQEDASLGVGHGVEVSYLFSDWLRTGLAATLGVPKNLTGAFDLGEVMVDYWISFVVELDPNDGKGRERPTWEPFAAETPTVLQLENGNITTIADVFREEPIDVFLDNPIAFRQ